jgi:dienelactone hydrolase
MTFAATSLAILLWLAVPGAARADELVEVAGHRAAIAPERADATPPLLGFLARPGGTGRFPAVILLHGCSGFDSHDTEAAATLKSWGYVALALDSLGSANLCAGRGIPGVAAEIVDAYAALRYLGAQSFVAGARVAVMGWSMGADASLAAVEAGMPWRAGGESFVAAIAYYPKCAAHAGVMTAPALVLVGEQDDWMPAAPCRKLAIHESDVGMTRDPATGTPIELIVLANATHGFDYRLPPHTYLGHVIRYDEAAARDAGTAVRRFLRDVLGDQADNP